MIHVLYVYVRGLSTGGLAPALDELLGTKIRMVCPYRQLADGSPAGRARRVAESLDSLVVDDDFPAEHWIEMRTTKPIDSSLPTEHVRTKVTPGGRGRAAQGSRWHTSRSRRPRSADAGSPMPRSSRWCGQTRPSSTAGYNRGATDGQSNGHRWRGRRRLTANSLPQS